MVGKQLSALLQILRSNGVTKYSTPELTLEVLPAPGKRAPVAINVSPEALDAERTGEDDPDEEEGDPRFLLERLGKRHFPSPRVDPKRNAS